MAVLLLIEVGGGREKKVRVSFRLREGYWAILGLNHLYYSFTVVFCSTLTLVWAEFYSIRPNNK
jgi:hypothetical protein